MSQKSEKSAENQPKSTKTPKKPLKVALVIDWLTEIGGAERTLKALADLYPSAPIYTSQYRKSRIDWFEDHSVKTGYLNFFPVWARRFIGPLRARFFRRLDLSSYDLVISVTGAEAKGVKTADLKTGNRATHLCYCHVPTQYYWQLYDEYLARPGFGALNPLVRFVLRRFINPLRRSDRLAAARPDFILATSRYAASQIKTYYGREASVIAPPVNVEFFAAPAPEQPLPSQPVENSVENSQNHSDSAKNPSESAKTSFTPFINASRQVTWKRLDLLISACIDLEQPLILIGSGPEHDALVKLAKNSPYITFLPFMSQTELKSYLKTSKAFLFPSLEPFGIAPVEALAAGTPVIAYGHGGAKDYIKAGKNGLFFDEQTEKSLKAALTTFLNTKFNKKQVSASVENFSVDNFKTNIKTFIHENVR